MNQMNQEEGRISEFEVNVYYILYIIQYLDKICKENDYFQNNRIRIYRTCKTLSKKKQVSDYRPRKGRRIIGQ